CGVQLGLSPRDPTLASESGSTGFLYRKSS
ncbi:hypothetical protein A2U01_0087042, partial [Trifolium medium]|nr:hypothetical protein [Trifolium medium]